MVGAISKREILFHPTVAIRCFGWTVFFRAVLAGPGETFLSLLTRAGAFGQPIRPLPEFIGRCIDLERRVIKLYESLSRHHSRNELVREFFEHLASQEREHAEWLNQCRTAAGRGRWQQMCFDRWRDALPKIEQILREAEAILDRRHAIADAMRLVIEVESSPINRLLSEVVEATEPRLAPKLQAFRNAVKDHLGYICERIPVLDPNFSQACQALWAEVVKDRLADSN